ncbi:MutS-related protein [Cohnella nanjingensis]|uniref:DNA mismatch repair proteins mutS family domain-containing protein n=1 Tax=Cohnella nanjingensis TaxID=1387779 RepID=A0A7X0VFJ1_9BACL|nr:hypothetical protein [Cohnella nanjingensis]MBB6671876.1 hypothetical protein [Cohnella nanjingensis]
MKPYLLYECQEFVPRQSLDDLPFMQDLQVEPLLEAMSQGDRFVLDTASKLVPHVEIEASAILYRQQMVKDCIRYPDLIEDMYAIASNVDLQAADYRMQMKPSFSRNISVVEKLKTATALIAVILTALLALRNLGRSRLGHDRSEGLIRLFRRLGQAYPDTLLSDAGTHCKLLQQAVQGRRLRIGASLGDGLKGTNYTLGQMREAPKFSLIRRPGKSGALHLAHSLAEIEESALANVLRIVRRWIDETLIFFELLRFESSFYVGCVRLHATLAERGCEVAFPIPLHANERCLSFTGLYDPGLVLCNGSRPVSNDWNGEDTLLLMISGTNQGGKTTFLRSIGLAQLMMQCGLFVPAASFRANLCDCIFTHFTREEDENMRSGKLDEELARLDGIVNQLTARSLLLMNEPFASTTEREGSAIAKDFLTVCYELQLKVCIVTHFYELADWAYSQQRSQVEFLSPERSEDGLRSYKLYRRKPTPTSYGEDLYKSVRRRK